MRRLLLCGAACFAVACGSQVDHPDSGGTGDAGASLDGGSVVDVTARGYYVPPSTYVSGLPSGGYITLPASLTHAELLQLHQDCVDRINAYRDGTLKFSNGTSDPGVPKPALNHLMGNDVCATAEALGDMKAGNGSGCSGAHDTAFSCPWKSSVAQNACCWRSGTTYSAIRTQLYNCLQGMWDEGIGQPDNAAWASGIGHWHSMRNGTFTQVACGFGFNSNGGVWMNQDFSAERPSSVPQTCSCTAVGASDGCGGICVAPP